MNSRLLNIVSAILLVVFFVAFPVFTGVAADTGDDPSCKDGICRQPPEMKAEWKAIYAYRIDSDVMGAAGDVLSYVLLHDPDDKDAFYRKMLSFHQIARRYRGLANIDRYGEDKVTEAYSRLCDAQELFEQLAIGLIDAATKNTAPPSREIAGFEQVLDMYEKVCKKMKDVLLAGITPETIKKDPELHAMLNLAEMMVTALDGVQEAYAYILMNDNGERDDFFAKMSAFSAAAGRFKELASVGQKGRTKRTALYAGILKSQETLMSSAKGMFAAYEKTKTPPKAEIVAFKKDARQLTLLVEELIDFFGSEGISPCNTRQ